MTCQQVQTNLSLYLYGELDFAQEEAFERHLETCALCQRALNREKEWHAAANTGRQDVSFELLSKCRRNLRAALRADQPIESRSAWWSRLLPSGVSATRWSAQIAAASFLVFAGFTAARLMDGGRLTAVSNKGFTQMGLLGTSNAHVRDIQPAGQNAVRIVIDRVQQQEVTGSLDDEAVRQWLFAAMQLL
jgi:anti-sigma factor RsiW